MPIRAIIFDMDDTLVRTAAIWKAAETSLLEWMGTSWSAELAGRYKGMNALDVAGVIHEQLGSTIGLGECQQYMRDALIGGFGGTIEPMPGAVELVRRLGKRFPMAVASGSPLAAIQIALTRLGIVDAFREIITSESVKRGKPFPDVFLRAAELLQTPPGECLVFEDSLIGCQAARAAGMACFVVPSTALQGEAMKGVATRVFSSLGGVGDDQVVEFGQR